MKSSNIIGGRYELGDEIGRGGSSTVYHCTHINLGIKYAVKIVDKTKIGNIAVENEAFILRDLQHKNIPKIIDVFEENGFYHIVREYCSGKNLRNIISSKGPIPMKKLYKISFQIADVLNYVHSLNPPMIYRDLKPSNIIVDENESVKLIDFGITRRFSEEKEDDTQYIGSQKYAAPEQFGLGQSTPRTDIYSFALLQYYMYTGEDYTEIYQEERWKKFLNDSELRLKKAILKAINLDPDKRQKNIQDFMKEAFEQYFFEHETELLPEEKILDIKKYKNSENTLKLNKTSIFQKINIGFSGLKHGVGVSHIALNSAINLKNKGYKVIFVESSGKRGLEELMGYLEGDDPKDKNNYGKFLLNGIQVYSASQKEDIPGILSTDYDVAIFDFGASHSHMGDFLRMQKKVFVIPSMPYSMTENLDLLSEILLYKDVKICVNLANAGSDDFISWLKIPKKRVFKLGFLTAYTSTDPEKEALLLKLCGFENNEHKHSESLLKRLFG